jgi:hypothetical protein
MSALNGRLKRLEARQRETDGRFPGWELLAGDCKHAEAWLVERGFATLLDAVVAGENDPLLLVFTSKQWLVACGHADALASVEANATFPPELQAVLVDMAACERRQLAFAHAEQAVSLGKLPDDMDLLQSGVRPAPIHPPG